MKIRKKVGRYNKLKSYDDLQTEFELAISKIQEACKHKDVTDWVPEYWAVAHSTGRQVKICKHCRKIVEIDDSVMQNWRKEQIKNNPKYWEKFSEKQKNDWIKKGSCSVPKGVLKEMSNKKTTRSQNGRKRKKEVNTKG